MKCLSCGREIRNQDSIRIGYGPVCYERLFGKRDGQKGQPKQKDGSENRQEKDIPGQMTLTDFFTSSD